ncbi:hypothetical protein KQI82_01885 [Oscillibacter sp. MSJ-2]|uniref:Uncharacterized protein n=1 Tax=Dysosmobacter acutus TaxID=2841504 RepID=A0ABS6F6L4_9FIRM|nr:hypothetical protein [Dysosmobacter acutus]MBU5625685.1 hypothetical protein [Dysosmobacter acutus]
MDEKILQIIPAPDDMWIRVDGYGGIFHTRVIGLALVEHADGYRDVQLMDITTGDGCIDLSGSAKIVYSDTCPDDRKED